MTPDASTNSCACRSTFEAAAIGDRVMESLIVTVGILAVVGYSETQADGTCFQKQYALDDSFAKLDLLTTIAFENVSDIVVNQKEKHVLVLQRSNPPVSVLSNNGTLLFTWKTQEIGYPHSLYLDQRTSIAKTTVWITDMAGEGELSPLAGKAYGHCVKQFTYSGEFIQSIGQCGFNTSGSSLDPLQFDRVTDLAINSMGYMYIADGDIGGMNNRVIVLDPSYRVVDVWNKENKPGSGPLQFNLPHSIAIDRCDRVWITDTLNNRIQIISSNGTFLGEWNCLGYNSLVYGIDVSYVSDLVMVTTKTSSGDPEIIFLPIPSQACDCSQLANFGTCSVHRRFAIKQDSPQEPANGNSMLHSIAVDGVTGSLYLSMLPGAIPPLKFSPVLLPPKSNLDSCSGSINPRPWPGVWSASVLLTPFHAEDLHTAHVEYSNKLQAMYISLYGTSGKIKEYLNIGQNTYTIIRNSTDIVCSGPYDYGWITPKPDWLAPYNCECKGGLNISGVETTAWTCPVHKLRDWYWMHSSNGSAWRMIFNNESNSTMLPVIGEYAMVHFSAYTLDTEQLESMYQICTANSRIFNSRLLQQSSTGPVHGFSYTKCSNSMISSLPSWPNYFHMTATMIPVVLNNASPFPTQVIYDWEIESQRTVMCEASQKHAYNAYLIHNNTYILNRSLDTMEIQCLSHLNFGPPKPNWMTADDCQCKGTITGNPALSPWNNTIIAVCPVTEDRVFWTWFSEDVGFAPLLFFETLTPADEGTGLALADYHGMHKGRILVDMQEFEVPPKCLMVH